MQPTRTLTLAVCGIVFSAVCHAQALFALDAPAQLAVRTAVTQNDWLQVQSLLVTHCKTQIGVSELEHKTVSRRAAAARAYVACLKQLAGAIQSVSIQSREAIQPLVASAEETEREATSQENFMGLNWGVGFGYSFSSSKAVDQASIVNGIVRVESERKQLPRAFLEFHKYLWCNKDRSDRELGTRGCGPFLAVSATEQKVLSGVGMGFMYGRKAKATDSDGFSIGIGVMLDGKVKDLADGFEENQAPPAGETQVRFKEKSRWSGMLFVTRTF
jgi:hypothetical protein